MEAAMSCCLPLSLHVLRHGLAWRVREFSVGLRKADFLSEIGGLDSSAAALSSQMLAAIGKGGPYTLDFNTQEEASGVGNAPGSN